MSNILQEGGLNPLTAVQKAYEWVAKPAINQSVEADQKYSRFKKDRGPHYKNAYNTVKRLGYDKSCLTFVLSLTNKPLPNLGGGKIGRRKPISYGRVSGKVDIHNAIPKVAPKKGFVLPGRKYTRPGNPLDSQLKYDPQTGQVLEIYEQPTGKTDVSMQHDVDYSLYGNKPKSEQVKCKNEADRKMIKTLDAIRRKERQWCHAMARSMIKTKQKLGLVLQTKNVKRC